MTPSIHSSIPLLLSLWHIPCVAQIQYCTPQCETGSGFCVEILLRGLCHSGFDVGIVAIENMRGVFIES